MIWLLAGLAAVVVYAATKDDKKSSSLDSKKTQYTDRNGITWEIGEEMKDFWGASPIDKGAYGGKMNGALGYTSYASIVSMIDGNAAGRDPVTGNITVPIET